MQLQYTEKGINSTTQPTYVKKFMCSSVSFWWEIGKETVKVVN